ncbi:MAG: cation diffusion facilitator family transporter [Balneolaceae bacterium]|jgi:cation diffusion facilitator family transporter
MASSSKKVIYAALTGNFLIAVTKFVAAFITGSSAMLSEGIHSTVDTGNQLLILLGLKKAAKPADKEYPFGHGKEVYFWSFVVAIMIFAVGAGISIYEGINSLMNPHPFDNPIMNYIVIGLAMIFEGVAWYYALREFRRTKGNRGYYEAIHKAKNPTTFVVLFEDSAAMLGLVIAFLGIAIGQWTGLYLFDGIASILIGMILGVTAAWLAYETKGLLIGESADPQIVRGIKDIASSHKAIEKVNEILTMHMGPEFILLNLSVDFQDTYSANDIEDSTQNITREIKSRFPRIKRIFIEAENKSMYI